MGPNTGELKPWSKWLIITGRITFGSGGPPLPGVRVIATVGETRKIATTDENGIYVFTSLEEERYSVTPEAPAAGMSFQPASENIVVLKRQPVQ